MKSKAKTLILTGGVLNSLMALFHIFLGYQIYSAYSGKDFYPLMQMLNVGGSLMIFFFAYTSLAYARELLNSKTGRSVIILNILLYLARAIGEVVLFMQPKILIIVICFVISGIYSTAFFLRTNEK